MASAARSAFAKAREELTGLKARVRELGRALAGSAEIGMAVAPNEGGAPVSPRACATSGPPRVPSASAADCNFASNLPPSSCTKGSDVPCAPTSMLRTSLVRTPHFERSPTESPDIIQEVVPRLRIEFAEHIALVQRESEKAVRALRTEVGELHRQNIELHARLAGDEGGRVYTSNVGNGVEADRWGASWDDVLRPLEQRCREEDRARVLAVHEARRLREEVVTLEHQAVRGGVETEFQSRVVTSMSATEEVSDKAAMCAILRPDSPEEGTLMRA